MTTSRDAGERHEQFVAQSDTAGGSMSGSARSVQITLGIRQVGAAIVAVALAVVLAVVLAFGQLMTTRPQTAPAAGAPPVVVNQGPPGSAPDRPGSGGHGRLIPQ
jgi:hypothetical protein